MGACADAALGVTELNGFAAASAGGVAGRGASGLGALSRTLGGAATDGAGSTLGASSAPCVVASVSLRATGALAATGAVAEAATGGRGAVSRVSQNAPAPTATNRRLPPSSR
ncbi:MAG TPA: hypothetical protein VEQ59_09875, partial [Polyangiaceae bacterium]|nr:hypothetical protein [Polyangiaceae bacterium]